MNLRANQPFTSLSNKVGLTLLFCAFLAVQPLLAHGGGILQVTNYPIDAYQVSVWTNPPTARANQTIHVTVGIARIDSGEPVLDAAVLISVVANNGRVVVEAAATTEQSVNRLFYEADLSSFSAGSYQVIVYVEGPEGRGDLAFPLVVEPISLWPWLGGSVVGAVILGLAVRLRRARSGNGRRERKTAVPRRRTVD